MKQEQEQEAKAKQETEKKEVEQHAKNQREIAEAEARRTGSSSARQSVNPQPASPAPDSSKSPASITTERQRQTDSSEFNRGLGSLPAIENDYIPATTATGVAEAPVRPQPSVSVTSAATADPTLTSAYARAMNTGSGNPYPRDITLSDGSSKPHILDTYSGAWIPVKKDATTGRPTGVDTSASATAVVLNGATAEPIQPATVEARGKYGELRILRERIETGDATPSEKDRFVQLGGMSEMSQLEQSNGLQTQAPAPQAPASKFDPATGTRAVDETQKSVLAASTANPTGVRLGNADIKQVEGKNIFFIDVNGKMTQVSPEKVAELQTAKAASETNQKNQTLFDQLQASEGRREALGNTGLPSDFDPEANGSRINALKSGLGVDGPVTPESVRAAREETSKAVEKTMSEVESARADLKSAVESKDAEKIQKTQGILDTQQEKLSALESRGNQQDELASRLENENKFGKLDQAQKDAIAPKDGQGTRVVPEFDEAGFRKEYKKQTGSTLTNRTGEIYEQNYKIERYAAKHGKKDMNCQYSAATGATTTCESTETAVKAAEVTNSAMDAIGGLAVNSTGQYQQSKASQSGSIADTLKADAKTSRVAGAQAGISALLNFGLGWWQGGQQEDHEKRAKIMSEVGATASDNLTGRVGMTGAGKNRGADGYVSARGEGEVGKATGLIVNNFRLNEDRYKLTVEQDQEDTYINQSGQRIQRREQFEAKKNAMVQDVEEIAGKAEQEQGMYAQRARNGKIVSYINSVKNAATAAIAYKRASDLNKAANKLNAAKTGGGPKFEFDQPGGGTPSTPGGSGGVGATDDVGALGVQDGEDVPDLGPGTDLDAMPPPVGAGPPAAGFEAGLGAGGAPGGPMAGGAVQSGSTAPTATDESAKAEAQAPGNVDGRDSTYQSFGAARGVASNGSGGKGGPDLSGLSGLMAKLLGSGDDEAEKQRRAGIMQFAGDQRAPAAGDSLLDRSVNLFKRVSEAYQHKNRSGAI